MSWLSVGQSFSSVSALVQRDREEKALKELKKSKKIDKKRDRDERKDAFILEDAPHR
jgi:hypothetical protein